MNGETARMMTANDPCGPSPHAAPPNCAPGDEGPLRREITIANPQGLHMRPAAAFAKRAREFGCAVRVLRGDQAVNGKSQLDLLLLAAELGTQLTLEVAGDNASEALCALGDLLAAAAVTDDAPPADLSAFD